MFIVFPETTALYYKIISAEPISVCVSDVNLKNRFNLSSSSRRPIGYKHVNMSTLTFWLIHWDFKLSWLRFAQTIILFRRIILFWTSPIRLPS